MSSRYVLRALSRGQRSQWDDFVHARPDGHLLQRWDWGELKRQAGWSPLRLVLWDEELHEIVAGAQVLRRTAPHVPLWAGHLAYIPKGPLLDWEQPVLCEAFFAQLDRYLRVRGAIALRLEPALAAGTAAGELVVKRLIGMHMQLARAVQPLRTILLDLQPDEQALLAAMKEKWRYNVRLAGRKGVTVRVAAAGEDVRAWYRLLKVTGTRDTFGIHTLDYYLNIWRLFAPDDTLRLFLAEYEGQVLAGIFVSRVAGQAIYLYGASSNEQRQLMPNYLLQWEAIRWAKQRGARLYDFWGIPETDAEDEAMAGVYRFKAGWGGHVVSFVGCYERIYRPLSMRFARRWL